MRIRLAACAALLLGLACGSPAVEPEVHPDPNAFTWSAELDGTTVDGTWDWRTSGSRAWVDWDGTALTAGTLVVVVRDEAGAEVYRDRAGAGSTPPAAATSTRTEGTWTVTVRAEGASGPGRVRITAVTGQ